jgi:ATP-dependent RNA helicase DeaD
MTSFEQTGLRPELQQAVAALGFEQPTPVQAQAIPAILQDRRDLVALAQTGTGKTGAFGLPLVNELDTGLPQVQALILSPTRELALQIFKDLETYARFVPGYQAVAVYGGTDIQKQIRALKKDVQVVVDTPGRTLDLIRRGLLDLAQIRYLVLDEADEMLNMGFQEDLDAILESTPEEQQTLLFSATIPSGVAKIARRYMQDPLNIQVGQRNAGADRVQHLYCAVRAKDRYAALRLLADLFPGIYGIVFCRTRRDCGEVAGWLSRDGYHADALHGDLSQAQRDQVMKKFRDRQLDILVATDVAARGLDVDDITHVINYQLPDDPEVYIHRSGRTGRAGKSGISISLVHSRETRRIKELEKMSGKTFQQKVVPDGRSICERQVLHLVDSVVETRVNEEEIAPFLPAILEKLEGLDRDTVIKQFVSVEFNRFLAHYKDAPDLNIGVAAGSNGSNGKGKRSQAAFQGMTINLGYRHQLNPKRLIGLLNDYVQDRDMRIGKIDIGKELTFFEVEAGYSREVVQAFDGLYLEDMPVRVASSNRPPSPSKRYRKGGKRKRV